MLTAQVKLVSEKIPWMRHAWPSGWRQGRHHLPKLTSVGRSYALSVGRVVRSVRCPTVHLKEIGLEVLAFA